MAGKRSEGFTIVELLMAVAIIGILLGLTATAVTGAIRKARDQQASACVALVNQGVAVYYATNGRWPGPIGSKTESGNRVETTGDHEYYELSGSEVRETVKALVDEARQGRPPMDISGLYVSRSSGESSTRAFGVDFLSAIHGTKKGGKKMKSGEMYFGYPESEHGWFRRFHAYYYPKTDKFTFTK